MAVTTEAGQPVEIFFSYCHEDEKLRAELEKHLSILKRQGVIAGWHDRKIVAGEEWASAIHEVLNAARVILLLVSADFLASDYCYDVELRRAMERHERGEAVVIPILLHECDWNGAPFGKLMALPTDAQPVTGRRWKTRAEAFTNIARGIRAVVESLPPPPLPSMPLSAAAVPAPVAAAGPPSASPLSETSPAGIPLGTVTFLFAGLDFQAVAANGGATLWETRQAALNAALDRYLSTVRQAAVAYGGYVFRTEGDSIGVAFDNTADALLASLHAQRTLSLETWNELDLRARLALHTGEAQEREGSYFGVTVHRAVRLLESGYGGQVLTSASTASLGQDTLPPGASLRDLGLHTLKDLQQPDRVYQLLHPDLPAEFPPLRSIQAFEHNLPLQLTSFIGREKELAEVKRLLAASRLLTLTGTGGTGKTRLALQSAADLLDAYPDGVWHVELATVTGALQAAQALAAVLNVREESGRPLLQAIVEHLKDKNVLLIVDNCEHVLAVCAKMIDGALRACPRLRILASSREPLNINGETIYRVPSLTLPDPRQWEASSWKGRTLSPAALMQYEAARLFVDRATAAKPSFAVTASNAQAVAQICWQLDGIPLALELAAARVKALPVEQIATRLSDCFRILTGGSRTSLPHQQTLRALIDWSHDLLSDTERTLFRRLAVFAKGWNLLSAEAICADDSPLAERSVPEPDPVFGSPTASAEISSPVETWEVLDLLTGLVDKSLVVYEEQSGEARYRLLETMRQYAEDRLTESVEGTVMMARHAEFYRQWVLEIQEKSGGPEKTELLVQLEQEYANVRSALEHVFTHGSISEAAAMTLALTTFWENRGMYREGREALQRCLARDSEVEPRALARLLNEAAAFAYLMAEYDTAIQFARRGLLVARDIGDRESESKTLNNLALMMQAQGQMTEAHALLEESLKLVRQMGDASSLARCLGNLGYFEIQEGLYPEAEKHLREALALSRKLGDNYGIANKLLNLGVVSLYQKKGDEAQSSVQQAMQMFREQEDPAGVAYALGTLAEIAMERSDTEAAEAHIRESLAICMEIGMHGFVPCLLEYRARNQALQQAYQECLFCLSAAQRLRSDMQMPRSAQEQKDLNLVEADVLKALSDEAVCVVQARLTDIRLETVVAETLQTTKS